jgi:hypothetical protein
VGILIGVSMTKQIFAISVFAVAIAIASCATELKPGSSLEAGDNGRYVPPLKSVNLPALWSGSVESVIVGGRGEIRTGVLRDGDWLRKETKRPSRVGRITSEVSYRNALDQQIVIPANTLVHAMQWSASSSVLPILTQPSFDGANVHHNPIEWCFSISNQAGCIFWENDISAYYVQMIENTQRSLIEIGLFGSRGPMPNIIEEEVDFGGPIVATDKISNITDESFKIVTLVRDGRQADKIAVSRTLHWSNINEVSFAGLRFKPVRNETGRIDAVEVQDGAPVTKTQ